MIQKVKSYSFKLFGFRFLIWKKAKRPASSKGYGGRIVTGGCRLIRQNGFISLAMPDGTPIPYQVDLKVRSNLNAIASATVKVYVSFDEPPTAN